MLWNYAKPEVETSKNTPVQAITPTLAINKQKVEKTYVFVPYWSFTRTITADSEHSLLYFGIGVDENGINKKDQGYAKLDDFVRLTPKAGEKILSIRMTDKNINAQILKNIAVQEEIINDAVALAKEYGFDGILLDYETSAFAFESTTNNISSFHQLFSKRVKDNTLLFYVTLYGDTYFQSRPFDVGKIGRMADRVIIMAYDFSKSRGNPGPNFPLIDRGSYGYSFQKMIEDYQADVENSKIVVAFGFFGYDWEVNDKGESVTNGIPLSSNEIQREFVDKCSYDSCEVVRDPQTMEPYIKYVKGSENHIIWYEDEVSVVRKNQYLKERGILETAIWAYSYY